MTNAMPLIMATALFVAAALAHRLTVGVLRGAVKRIAKRTTATWDDRIIERKVLARLAYAVPAVVIYYGIGPALGLGREEILAAAEPLAFLALVTQRVALSFIVLSAAMAASAMLDAINDIYVESYAEARSRPIKGYLQVIGIVLYIASGVVVVSLLADRSPVVFLSGLGALTAVLMLVFRDTILSLVASVQIMSNDMIRIGDWVEMPQANADGDVIDIALHTVKIQNWDKTITTIPTHKFISESFKNWRGMSESGGRRIKRALHLDLATVRFLTPDEVQRLGRYELLSDYMARKRSELDEHTAAKRAAASDGRIPEMRRLTNVGTFRAYVIAYLRAHPLVHQDMTLLVRQLAPTPQGLPIEIYCFTSDTAWATYEGIQADIFDHLMAILPEFGLRAYQQPAGSDFTRLASLGSNGSTGVMVGDGAEAGGARADAG
jgi:miniconductance mechanosensitive channel